MNRKIFISDIQIRTFSEANSLRQLPQGFEMPSKKDLERWYVIDKKNANEI